MSHGSPNQALLSSLGVLRRPATRQDRLPQGLGGPVGRSLYIDHVRLARVAHGISYYLVPVAPLPYDRAALDSCDHALRTALKSELPRIPAGLRAPILAFQAWELTYMRRIERENATDGVCLMFTAADGQGGSCAATASEIKQWGMIGPFGPLSGVVPDGVATVTVHYTTQDGVPAQTASSNVVENVFVTTLTQSRGRQWRLAMTWRDREGGIVRRVAANSYDYRYGGGAFCGSQGRNGHPSNVC